MAIEVNWCVSAKVVKSICLPFRFWRRTLLHLEMCHGVSEVARDISGATGVRLSTKTSLLIANRSSVSSARVEISARVPQNIKSTLASGENVVKLEFPPAAFEIEDNSELTIKLDKWVYICHI